MGIAIPALMVDLDGRHLPEGLVRSVARLEVRDRDDEASVATLKFLLSYSEDGGIEPLDHADLLPGHLLSLTIKAPDHRLIKLFEGRITHLRPHLEVQEGEGFLEVVAMDVLAEMDLAERPRLWEGTDTDIVHGLFDEYEIFSIVGQSSYEHRLDGIAQAQAGTDASLLRRICRRNGWTCYVEPQYDGSVVARCAPRDPEEAGQPKLVLRGEGACLDWVDLQWNGTRPSKIWASAVDPLEGKVIRGQASHSDNSFGEEDILQARHAAFQQPGGMPALGHRLRHPPVAQSRIETEARAEMDAERFMVEARGSLSPERYGQLLRARRPVDLVGLGRRYSGRWWLREVVTELADGTLHQTFVAERNALSPIHQQQQQEQQP